MKFAWLLLVIVIAIPLVACGSSGSGPTGNQLPPNIISVSPADGAVISRQDLISQGITANFDFRAGAGLGYFPTNFVRFYINDNNDVTMKLNWTITKDNPPSRGSFLYEPGESISSGWKTLKIWYWNIDGAAPTDKHYEYIWRIYVKD